MKSRDADGRPAAASLLLAALSAALLSSACTPFTRAGAEPGTLSKLDGSWEILRVGNEKPEGVRAELSFDSSKGSVSGFDGCNRMHGTFAFEEGRFKARAATTRMACLGEPAVRVSSAIHRLFTEGCEVVEEKSAKGRVLVMRNGSTEIRLGPKP